MSMITATEARTAMETQKEKNKMGAYSEASKYLADIIQPAITKAIKKAKDTVVISRDWIGVSEWGRSIILTELIADCHYAVNSTTDKLQIWF